MQLLSLLVSLCFQIIVAHIGCAIIPMHLTRKLAYVSTSRVSRIRESAVNAWVKEIKSICQVKGQPEIIHLVKSQSKYLVSQNFDLRQSTWYIGVPTLVIKTVTFDIHMTLFM